MIYHIILSLLVVREHTVPVSLYFSGQRGFYEPPMKDKAGAGAKLASTPAALRQTEG